MAEPNQDQCQYFLERKKRLCRFRPRPGEQYCPEHACVLGIQSERKRIPCPLNPKHNCYEDDLQNHLKKCPVTKSLQATAKLGCYMKDINSGYDNNEALIPSKDKKSVKELTDAKLQEIMERVNSLFTECVEDIEVLHLEHSTVKEHFSEESDVSLEKVFGDQVVLKKELLQQASLVGQLDNLGFLSNDHCFVELGAGKGKLSHWIQLASKSCTSNNFVLVDRGSVRYKMDNFHKGEGFEGKFHRIKIDIKDLCLGKVPEVQGKSSVVIIGKHLCGGATDMGIRCAVDTLKFQSLESQDQSDPPSSTSTQFEAQVTPDAGTNHTDEKQALKNDELEPPPQKIIKTEMEHPNFFLPEGMMIALCCHHRCTWDTYIGKEFMKQNGIGPEDFDTLTRLSSWATCARTKIKNEHEAKICDENVGAATKQKDVTNEVKDTTSEDHCVEDLIGHSLSGSESLRETLSITEREEIGRKCKRILDVGRIQYLKTRGMTCMLREYVDEKYTPENIVLIAVRPPESCFKS